ncbi:TPA: DUF4224 domain-containing protein [Aeromonas salmonicida]|uniref:DUF4224 domain-containing protein n=1 Tax=Aeromonas salmonicida subsp. salmonicida TaxID=29491 RepID=A0A0B0EXM9_AERSS|nr:putative phage protein [Aeromonas salmonicida subsp. salmonicida]ELY1969278.1 DUF4224 domain-containing protein [Aeromonas salmonicida]ELI6443110.1 DUF4224 domain-containing protein [Aeromonas salmonicida subsp. salmonicida]ELY2000728.1 DUF4224 domain-containing protein [Aeromonas salmonicida]KHE97359.1 hypothetical protein NX85_17520 [Aeromonas salmonicida subsp. salmonicida]
MNKQLVVSDQEIEQLTGYKLPSKQCKALEKAGIRFLRRPDGRPSTTREWLTGSASHHPANDDRDNGFNLEALS